LMYEESTFMSIGRSSAVERLQSAKPRPH
jgi:hypothetical protein